MKFRKVRVTQFASAAFIVFALLLYFVFNPLWVPDNRTFGVSPRVVPNLCAFAFIILGAMLFLETFGKKSKENNEMIELSADGIKMMLIAFSSVAIWAICVKITHYIPTVIALLAIDMWVLGQRNKVVIAAVSVILPLCFWALFTFGFKMQLP